MPVVPVAIHGSAGVRGWKRFRSSLRSRCSSTSRSLLSERVEHLDQGSSRREAAQSDLDLRARDVRRHRGAGPLGRDQAAAQRTPRALARGRRASAVPLSAALRERHPVGCCARWRTWRRSSTRRLGGEGAQRGAPSSSTARFVQYTLTSGQPLRVRVPVTRRPLLGVRRAPSSTTPASWSRRSWSLGGEPAVGVVADAAAGRATRAMRSSGSSSPRPRLIECAAGAAIEPTGREGRSEALEHLMEHMILRKQDQVDFLLRARRSS